VLAERICALQASRPSRRNRRCLVPLVGFCTAALSPTTRVFFRCTGPHFVGVSSSMPPTGNPSA
jgi:hypothetical protein